MKFLFLFSFLFLTACSTIGDRFPASSKQLVGDEFVLANFFWDEDKNFVINETKEFYHNTYAKSPFVLGDMAGQVWQIKKDKLKKIYQLDKQRDFGTFSAYYNDKFLYMIRTNQYYLGKKGDVLQFGVRFLPYDESGDARDLDAYIRSRMGLSANDVFVTPTYYFHPEYSKGNVLQLDRSSRFDDGFTHMGAYIGDGQTRNAPYDYHEMKLQTKGYPANLTRVVYKGSTDQREFQKNFYATLKILNELNGGVKFSRLSYQQDYYDANNLKAIFDFYRAWLDPKWIRKKEDGKPFYEMILDDVKYDVYCSEHIAMVLNIAVNLVQTEAGYIRVFGKNSEQERRGEAEQEKGILKGGEYFWKVATERWVSEIKGSEFPKVQDSAMKELWRIYNRARPIVVTRVTEVGRYLAWPPQTLTDLIANVMNLYARFDRVGLEVSLKTLQSMKELIYSRVTFRDKSKVFIKNSIVDFPLDKLNQLIRPFENLIQEYWELAKHKGTPQAYKEFQMAAQRLVFKYRDPEFLGIRLGASKSPLCATSGSDASVVAACEKESFFYYATPHVIHRIIQGLHPYSKYLEFEILGTVLPASDLELNNN